MSASTACEKTMADCGVAVPAAFPRNLQLLDLKGCCQVVLGACAGTAANIPCSTGDSGSCSPEEFAFKYQNYVASECRDTVCLSPLCSAALAGDPVCN